MQRDNSDCGGKRVLVADDEELIRNVTRQILVRQGMEVRLACDGLQAVEMFRANPEGFDVVLLDMTMPEMDGEEAFHEIRQIRHDVPVILCSGYSEYDIFDSFSADEFTGFLQKPFRMTELVAKVSEATEGNLSPVATSLVHAKAG